jgi:pimeloyl-ACP methyl ester carboxylesterase
MLPLLCIHGALATHTQFDPLFPHIADAFTLHTLTRVSLFGYSLGGYVACMVAQAYPERVEGVVTLGTRY